MDDGEIAKRKRHVRIPKCARIVTRLWVPIALTRRKADVDNRLPGSGACENGLDGRGELGHSLQSAASYLHRRLVALLSRVRGVTSIPISLVAPSKRERRVPRSAICVSAAWTVWSENELEDPSFIAALVVIFPHYAITPSHL